MSELDRSHRSAKNTAKHIRETYEGEDTMLCVRGLDTLLRIRPARPACPYSWDDNISACTRTSTHQRRARCLQQGTWPYESCCKMRVYYNQCGSPMTACSYRKTRFATKRLAINTQSLQKLATECSAKDPGLHCDTRWDVTKSETHHPLLADRVRATVDKAEKPYDVL